MSEYPWDFENMVLEQHNQPCDCAICDEIHFQRLMRRKRREEMKTSTTLNPDLAATVNHYQNREFGTMNVTDQLNCEIYRLREENERFKVMYKGFENQYFEIQRLNAELAVIRAEVIEQHNRADVYEAALTQIIGTADEDWDNGQAIANIAREALNE